VSDPAIVCVFAKPPRPGEVKTRLAERVGDAAAADLARAFLGDTWETLSGLPSTRIVLATTGGSAEDHGLADAVEMWLQGEGDLGARLERVLQRALGEAPVALAIGADSPGLPLRHVVAAEQALGGADAVLGPSDDGGFYLVGLRSCPVGLFAGLPWSRPETCAATRSRFEERGLRVRMLEPFFDVDHFEDLARLDCAIEAGEIAAPRTRRVLDAMRPR
jgi:uncharacterized protein